MSYNDGDFKSDDELKKMEKLDVELFVKKCFSDIGADFNNPKKEDLVKVCDKLAEFASHFRSQDIIKKHYNEIKQLIDKIH